MIIIINMILINYYLLFAIIILKRAKHNFIIRHIQIKKREKIFLNISCINPNLTYACMLIKLLLVLIR